MKGILLFSVLVWSITSVFAQDYKLVWEDNFDGDELNPAIWNIEQKIGVWNTRSNKELQHYKAENVSVGDDGNGNNCLILTAKKENYNGYAFTSGRVNSKGKLNIKYGKIEARIKLPDLANGLWPAFWLLGNNDLKWPASGEIDIMEAGHAEGIAQNKQNTTFGGALHWEHNDNRASYGTKVQSTTPLNEEYHLFTAEWDDKQVRMYLDDNTSPYFVMNVNGADAEEFRDYPMQLLFNLAVGGSFTGILNPSGISAPMPSKMYVDYIRVYQKEGEGELIKNPPLNNLAVYIENMVLDNFLEMGFDANILTQGLNEKTDETAFEGNEVLSYNLTPAHDYSMSIVSLAIKNLTSLAKTGSLDFYIKTNTTSPIQLGLKDTLGAEKWINLDESSPFNCERDGSWCRVIIPLSEFDNLDYSKINGVFMIKGTSENNSYISIDRIILSKTVYGIYTNNPLIKEKFEIDNTNGYLYIWENTLERIEEAPSYEGDDLIAFTSINGKTWFGFGLFSNAGIDLSLFSSGYLKLALRTTSSSDFWIGVGGADDTEAKIDFKNGSDPYGFVRDGKWHRVTIPVSDLIIKGLDLTSCKDIFMLGGEPTITNILVDDIYLSKSEEGIINNELNSKRDYPLRETIKITSDYYRIFSENTAIQDHFEIDNKTGHIYIWENSMRVSNRDTPYDGEEQLSFIGGNLGWYGFGIFSDNGLDLTHFANGFLSLSVKTSSREDFWIGIQGDENTEGKIDFKIGSRVDIERDNNWHRVTIPMVKFTEQGLKLKRCGNIFMLGGSSISDIAVDDIILSTNTTPPENSNINGSTSAEMQGFEKLKVYPVPIDNYLILQANTNISFLEIYNQSGALVHSSFPAGQSLIKVDVQDFVSGIYMIRVKLNNNEMITKKIVKK
jgi:beta-glucanase (GH16 family)